MLNFIYSIRKFIEVIKVEPREWTGYGNGVFDWGAVIKALAAQLERKSTQAATPPGAADLAATLDTALPKLSLSGEVGAEIQVPRGI